LSIAMMMMTAFESTIFLDPLSLKNNELFSSRNQIFEEQSSYSLSVLIADWIDRTSIHLIFKFSYWWHLKDEIMYIEVISVINKWILNYGIQIHEFGIENSLCPSMVRKQMQCIHFNQRLLTAVLFIRKDLPEVM
jgi:hypothetical protein